MGKVLLECLVPLAHGVSLFLLSARPVPICSTLQHLCGQTQPHICLPRFTELPHYSREIYVKIWNSFLTVDCVSSTAFWD